MDGRSRMSVLIGMDKERIEDGDYVEMTIEEVGEKMRSLRGGCKPLGRRSRCYGRGLGDAS